MMTYFKGHIKHLSSSGLVLESGGVGYLFVCPDFVYDAARECSREDCFEVWCVAQAREDGTIFYGLRNFEERAFFLLLLNISGVGGRLALNLLSVLGKDGVIEASLQGDPLLFQKVGGVGKKMAERLVLELKNKRKQLLELSRDSISKKSVLTNVTSFKVQSEALQALKALGYKEAEVQLIMKKEVQKMATLDLSVLLQNVLKQLGAKQANNATSFS